MVDSLKFIECREKLLDFILVPLAEVVIGGVVNFAPVCPWGFRWAMNACGGAHGSTILAIECGSLSEILTWDFATTSYMSWCLRNKRRLLRFWLRTSIFTSKVNFPKFWKSNLLKWVISRWHTFRILSFMPQNLRWSRSLFWYKLRLFTNIFSKTHI